MISLPSVICNMFASATPIALAGVGGMFGERSGITNIGLDGTMLFAAFTAVTACYYTGSPWIALLAGILSGVLVSFLHAYFCISLKVDQTIIGLAVNILAASVTVYASSSIFGNKGFTPSVTKLPNISIPGLRDLPVVGAFFDSASLVTLLVLPVVLLAHYLLYKTPFGMRTIAVGQNPQAAFVAGVNVKKTQYIAVMLGGLTCGMAGAYLSISYLSMFVRDMVSGRGFIAIAAILTVQPLWHLRGGAVLRSGGRHADRAAGYRDHSQRGDPVRAVSADHSGRHRQRGPHHAAQRHQVRKEGTPYEDNDTRRALYALPEL